MPKMVITNKSDIQQRADVLLANAYPEYSRAALAKLFDQAVITQDNKPIKAGEKLKPGEKFKADISNLQKQAIDITLPILYEDKNVIVIDKPASIISHATGKYWEEPSVASFVRKKVSGLEGERAGIVHRLDKATSGVMICAKNPETMSFLQKQFSSRKTKKVYYAVIEGKLESNEAIIDVPIGRNPKKPQIFRPDANGKIATTTYKVIITNNSYSLLELRPTTGRTHQIRVHLKHINRPIVGDDLYGGYKADRLYLHAFSLEITIPGGTRKVFISPLPPEFAKLIP